MVPGSVFHWQLTEAIVLQIMPTERALDGFARGSGTGRLANTCDAHFPASQGRPWRQKQFGAGGSPAIQSSHSNSFGAIFIIKTDKLTHCLVNLGEKEMGHFSSWEKIHQSERGGGINPP